MLDTCQLYLLHLGQDMRQVGQILDGETKHALSDNKIN